MTKKQIEGKDFIWKRVGTCQPKKCGAFCCRLGPNMLRFPAKGKTASRDEDYKKFESFFGIRKLGTIHNGKTALYGMPLPCKHLCGLKCGIHGTKEKPDTCKTFPAHPSQEWYQFAKQNGCTYRFKRVPIKKRRTLPPPPEVKS